VPPEIVEAFARDILLVLRHVAKNRDGAHEETEDGEPYLSVIRATQFDDAAVAEIDTLADLTLWVTDAENPEDGPVRDAAKRLLRAARADGR
jgi:hypothetical protein